jgi:hypothetical protein
MYVNVELVRVRVTNVAVEKQEWLHILIVDVALVTGHTKRMRRFIFSSVACLALPCSSTLPHKR